MIQAICGSERREGIRVRSIVRAAAEEAKTLSELTRLCFQGSTRDEILVVLGPAFELDRIAPAEPFLKLMDRKSLSAVPADHGAVLAAVSEFMRIAARTGVEIGLDPGVHTQLSARPLKPYSA